MTLYNPKIKNLSLAKIRVVKAIVFTSFIKSITFGKRLTEVRKAGKISQDALAKMVGVHGAVIGRYERDEVKPSI